MFAALKQLSGKVCVQVASGAIATVVEARSNKVGLSDPHAEPNDLSPCSRADLHYVLEA